MGIKDEDLGFFAPERRPIKVSYFLGFGGQHNNLGVSGHREGFMTTATTPSRDQNFFIAINREDKLEWMFKVMLLYIPLLT